MFERGVTKRCRQQIVKLLGPLAAVRFGGFQQVFQHGLPFERGDQLMGCYLLLTFDQPQQHAGKFDRSGIGQAAVPISHLQLAA